MVMRGLQGVLAAAASAAHPPALGMAPDDSFSTVDCMQAQAGEPQCV
jgi:hypothetical protein